MYVLFTPCAKSMATTKIIIQTVIGIFSHFIAFPKITATLCVLVIAPWQLVFISLTTFLQH